jgi:hypothetical protein
MQTVRQSAFKPRRRPAKTLPTRLVIPWHGMRMK